MEGLVADFAEDGIHHDEETDGYKDFMSVSYYEGETVHYEDLPMGMETPTNFPLSNAGPVEGTKFPRMIPMAMARKIHSARKRSSHPRDLNADTFWDFSSSLGGGTLSMVGSEGCCMPFLLGNWSWETAMIYYNEYYE